MTKADIINKIVADTGLAKKDVATTIEAFMEEIRQSLTEKKKMYSLEALAVLLLSTVHKRQPVTFQRIRP